MIKNLSLEDSHNALKLLLGCNLASLNRLFVDFHNAMQKAHDEKVEPPMVPQDRANHIIDLMVALYPFLDLLKSDFTELTPAINWLEENCKRIFKDAELNGSQKDKSEVVSS